MPSLERPETPVRSALFIDFDNIYTALEDADPRAAERFATSPQDWLRWLATGMPEGTGEPPDEIERVFLIRRCYLNPARYQRFRSDFVRAGFEVVDSPPLTRFGKTSTDIRMVMDVLDTLRHETRFDEFVLMSSDADFTPILLRLRAHDRRTMVLAIGPSASAYRSACELVIDEVSFVENALGIEPGAEPPAAEPGASPTPTSYPGLPPGETPKLEQELGSKMALALFTEAAARPGGELFPSEIPGIYLKFREFTPQSNWLGFFGLKGLTEYLASVRGDLAVVADPKGTWKLLVAKPGEPGGAADAAEPAAASAEIPTADEGLAALVRRVSQVTGTPRLSSADYGRVFRALEAELARSLFNLATTSKFVRDRLVDQGRSIARGDLMFVLRGIQSGGHPLGRDGSPSAARDLAEAFARHVTGLCRDARLELSEEDLRAIGGWITADVAGTSPA